MSSTFTLRHVLVSMILTILPIVGQARGGSDSGGAPPPHSDQSLREIKGIMASAKVIEALALNRQVTQLKLIKRFGGHAYYELTSAYIDGVEPCTMTVEVETFVDSVSDTAQKYKDGMPVTKVEGAESCRPYPEPIKVPNPKWDKYSGEHLRKFGGMAFRQDKPALFAEYVDFAKKLSPQERADIIAELTREGSDHRGLALRLKELAPAFKDALRRTPDASEWQVLAAIGDQLKNNAMATSTIVALSILPLFLAD